MRSQTFSLNVLNVLFLIFCLSSAALAAWPGYSKPEYFLVRKDLRRCASPMCGGFFLNPVNLKKFDCPRGERTKLDECYVAEIRGLESLDMGKLALVRGKFVDYNEDVNAFVAYEAYSGAIAHRTKGADFAHELFFSIMDQSITCIAHPCNTFFANKVNEIMFQRPTFQYGEIDFSRVTRDDTEIRSSLKETKTIVSAVSYPISGPAGESLGLRATNYFTKLEKPTHACATNRDCMKGEMCSKASCESRAWGVCKERPISCSRDFEPVCACDGVREFPNDCARMLLGVTAAIPGKCATSSSGA